MSYLVMETKRSYAVLLDQEGRFLKAANLHYQVGQTVTDPVLLREKSEKGRLIPLFAGGGAALAGLAACLVFAVILPLYQQATSVYSSIYMTINPQVRMELNKGGDVIGLAPTNEDGETLLQGYELSEDDPADVADDLLDRAIQLGFLEEGGRVNFSIDTPEEALFQEYGMELRREVEDHLDGEALRGGGSGALRGGGRGIHGPSHSQSHAFSQPHTVSDPVSNAHAHPQSHGDADSYTSSHAGTYTGAHTGSRSRVHRHRLRPRHRRGHRLLRAPGPAGAAFRGLRL